MRVVRVLQATLADAVPYGLHAFLVLARIEVGIAQSNVQFTVIAQTCCLLQCRDSLFILLGELPGLRQQTIVLGVLGYTAVVHFSLEQGRRFVRNFSLQEQLRHRDQLGLFLEHALIVSRGVCGNQVFIFAKFLGQDASRVFWMSRTFR